jgi:hypothetical protein
LRSADEQFEPGLLPNSNYGVTKSRRKSLDNLLIWDDKYEIGRGLPPNLRRWMAQESEEGVPRKPPAAGAFGNRLVNLLTAVRASAHRNNQSDRGV